MLARFALDLLAAAAGCPDCLAAREARAMVVDHHPMTNLWIAVAPFIITLAIILLVVRAVSTRARHRTGDDDHA